MKRIFLLLLSIICVNGIYSQEISIKSFKQNMSDGSAFHAPIDANGSPCGLIKVQSADPLLFFKGNIVGQVENKTNEYWIYLPKGTDRLTVCHPNYLPIEVLFSSYGVDLVESKATYVMVLKDMKPKEKNILTIVTKPEDAVVYIDNTLIDIPNNNGYYMLYLPKGEHVSRIEADGYRPNLQAVTTGKGPQNVTVTLESLYADLDIICSTTTADLSINGEHKGKGGWKGRMKPGKVLIEVGQEGYKPYKKEISLLEKERKVVKIPALEIIKGDVKVNTTPNDCYVYVDGVSYGHSPITITNLDYGNHLILIKLDTLGLKYQKELDVNISQEGVQSINCELVSAQKYDLHKQAFSWFETAGYYPGSIPDEEEVNWFNKILNVIEILDEGFFFQEILEKHMGGKFKWKLGDIMVICYSGDSNGLDKQIAIAEKMERKSWEANQEVADSYERMGNKKKAIEWYEAALRVLQLELDVKNDDADRLQIIRDTIIESINECKN